LNSSNDCSFSLLSCEVSNISNACLSIVSNAQRHTCLCGVWVQHGRVGRKFHDNLFHLDSYSRCFYVEKDDVKENIVVVIR
jgi:hypothetical protein